MFCISKCYKPQSVIVFHLFPAHSLHVVHQILTRGLTAEKDPERNRCIWLTRCRTGFMDNRPTAKLWCIAYRKIQETLTS